MCYSLLLLSRQRLSIRAKAISIRRTLEVDGAVRPYSDLIVWTSQFGYVYLPSTVVPVGFTKDGSPVGIQVVGPYLGDRTTLEFARHIERLRGGYQVPPIAKL